MSDTEVQAVCPDMPEDLINEMIKVYKSNFKVNPNDEKYQNIQENFYHNLREEFWGKFKEIQSNRIETQVLFKSEIKKVQRTTLEFETQYTAFKNFLITGEHKGNKQLELFVKESKYIDYEGCITTLHKFNDWLELSYEKYLGQYYYLTEKELTTAFEEWYQNRTKEENLVPKIDNIHSNGENLDFADVLIDFTKTEILDDHDYNTIHKLSNYMNKHFGLPDFRRDAVISNLEDCSKYYTEIKENKGLPKILNRKQVGKAIRKSVQMVDRYRVRKNDPLPSHKNGKKIELYTDEILLWCRRNDIRFDTELL